METERFPHSNICSQTVIRIKVYSEYQMVHYSKKLKSTSINFSLDQQHQCVLELKYT